MAITRRNFLGSSFKGLALLVTGAIGGKLISDEMHEQDEIKKEELMQNLSKRERDLYLNLYGLSNEKWEQAKPEYQKFLDDFSKNREEYTKLAENYPWMRKRKLTQKDQVYLSLIIMLDGLEASYYQHGGIGGVILAPDSKNKKFK